MSDPLFSVADQIVLVSGGSRGIGRALAQGFAQRGAQVIICGRDQRSLEETAAQIGTARNPVCPRVCDVSKSDQIADTVSWILAEFDHVDTLLNVAGVNRRKPAIQLTEADYDFVMDINLKGAFLLSLAVGKHMIQRRSGSQINIGSLNNDRPLAGVLPYAMSKAGLGHLTRSLALEWGEHGVRVNGIAPGFILTDLTRQLWAQPRMRQWGIPNTPLRRLGEVDDLVGTALFLASRASAFITGQMLFVDGGFSSGLPWPIDYAEQ